MVSLQASLRHDCSIWFSGHDAIFSCHRRQPLTREQLWSTASDAAEAGAAKAAAGGEAGGGEGAEEGAGGAQPPQGGQEEAPGGPQAHAFEAGHLLEIARDPQSGYEKHLIVGF